MVGGAEPVPEQGRKDQGRMGGDAGESGEIGLNVSLPANLVRGSGPERRAWLSALPAIAAEFAGRWSLTVDAPFEPGGDTAWVAPARSATGESVVLKLGWRHDEGLHEAEGLKLWSGDGAVRILASAEAEETSVLLLERCLPGTVLRLRPESEQDGIVAGLLRRLWRAPPVPGPFRPLAAMCDRWAERFEAEPAAWVAVGDRGLAAAGMDLLRSLPRTAGPGVLLCTDLHAGNILAATREPWLMIDPKPYVGDAHYDVLQHMLNCPDRLEREPQALIRRMADLAGLDRERVSLWLFARLIEESQRRPQMAAIARRLAP